MYDASSNGQKPIEGTREEDRISALPDSLLLHILSFLFAGDLIKTSALSKRWQFLWTSVPNLKLDEDIQMKSRKHDFVSSVYGILILRGQDKLKEFYVNISNYSATYQTHLNVWIHYAVVCNVEELIIYTFADNDYELYNLPVHLFRNSCLTKLDLDYCILEPIGEINWKNLKRLYIGHECITQELISNILSGSPSLERLKLSYCEGSGFDVLNFTSISLRKLVVSGYNGNQDHSKVLKIRAPNVLSLKITEDMSTLNGILLDVPSLVEAYLDFWLDPIDDIESITAYEDEEEMLKRLIKNLHHVNELKLGELSLEVLSRLKAKDFTCPPNMKSHAAS